MDSLRGHVSDSDVRDDAGIEAPPAVGTDERRMQVRAYNFWAALLGNRAYPAIEDLEIETLDDFGPHAVLLDFTAGIENPAISFLGDELRAESGIGEDVHYIAQVPSRSVLSRLTDHYLQIIANRAPIGFEAEFVNDRGTTIMYRGILLPFSSDDDTIDFIMGVINWKEAAPAAESDVLELEVEQALRSAPPPVASVPVWADGPDSEHIDDEEEADGINAGFASLGARDALAAQRAAAGDDEAFAPPPAALPAASAPAMVAARSPESDGAEEVFVDDVELDDDAALADWLAVARDTADRARDADVRSRGALYAAVGRAYDFALAAYANPEDFAELIADAGLTFQERAPLTPVVKLVFGAGYDKTRLAEYACVLGHAVEAQIERGGLTKYLENYSGGLKALVRDERARKKPDGTSLADRIAAVRARWRDATPVGFIELGGEGDDEFILFVGRRMGNGGAGVVGVIEGDEALVDRVLGKARPLA